MAAYSFLALQFALGQGALTPPGAPAPTMLTLSQIEPRTPISAAPFTITASGSYYLTTNLAVTSGNAIIINANNVTLDLDGFTISSSDPGADPSGTGILLNNINDVPGHPGMRDITIHNGVIAGSYTNNSGIWEGAGFNSGINFSSAVPPSNVRIRDVSVFGCFDYGIVAGLSGSVVESCTVESVGTYGIYANSVCRSVVSLCGNHAIIGREVSNCDGNCLGSGDGIYGVRVNNSYGNSQSGDGIYAQNGAGGSFGQSDTGTGLYSDGPAIGCYGWSTSNGGGWGLIAVTAENCYGEADGSGEGVYTTGAADDCRGRAKGPGDAVSATCANNCIGISDGGSGIYATIAIGCWGSNTNGSAIQLQTFIGNSCSGNGGPESVAYKYNMP